MNEEAIPVILSCDDKFVRHAACTIASIVKNSDRRYQFYLLDCGISEGNKRKLAAWDLGGNTLTVMPMTQLEVFDKLARLSSYYPPANFYRMLLPEIFPHIEQAIYLDSDIVVVGDLGELWDIDLGDKLMGVVFMEPDFISSQFMALHKERYQIPLEHRYFNNGVMLMNFTRLKAWGYSEKLLALVRQFSNQILVTPCETIFNKAFENQELLALHPRFNFLNTFPYAKHLAKNLQPVVVHYMDCQPWKWFQWMVDCWPFFHYAHSKAYYRYIDDTPFAQERYRDVTLWNIVRELGRHLLRPLKRRLIGNV